MAKITSAKDEADSRLQLATRYSGLIGSIAVLIFIITVLLIFTFISSSKSIRNVALINQAHTVAKEGQSVIKDLFDLQNSFGESMRSPHMQRVLKRLAENSESITESLEVIDKGSIIKDDSGKAVLLPKITDYNTLNSLDTARLEWAKLRPRIENYLEHAEDITVDSSDDLTLAVEQAKTSSLLINQSLSAVSSDIYGIAESEAERIRLIQLAGVIFVFAYFVIFIVFFIRKLRVSDNEAFAARRETKEIMQTVNTGLFLLDKKLNIGNQHSKALEDIMGTSNLGGENLTNVLRNRISDKDLETTRQFIEQLYNPRVKTKLVNDLNPLNKVMLHNELDGTASENYLDFKFSRVYENGQISRILVNVSDVTEAVMLENRLEKEREQNDLQIEMLTTILNVNPVLVHQFINNTNAHIESINNTLKNPGSSQFELETKLKSIYREIHSLKGEASALKLHSFTQIATQAEDKLQSLQNQGKLSGNDFLPLAVDLDDLVGLTNTIKVLGQRINESAITQPIRNDELSNATLNQFNGNNQVSDPVEHNNTMSNTSTGITDTRVVNPVEVKRQHLKNAVQSVAERQGKKVELLSTGLDLDLPPRIASAIDEITIQLLRNSVVHGIETPEARAANSKDETGKVLLTIKKTNGFTKLIVEDDGGGINYVGIRNRLVEKGQYDEETAKKLTKSKLLNTLFSSGFSTKNSVDEDAGRGVGLDIIKDRVKQLNGKINVNSEAGKMTRFIIAFPNN